MAIEKVREYFSSFGIENRILEFEVSSATVELAAKALNCCFVLVMCATLCLRLKYVKGQHVALMWASPDCTSHSKAKGGKPREKGLRILPWAVYKL